MDRKQVEELLEKYFNGQCTAEEKIRIGNFYLNQIAYNPEPSNPQEYDQVTATALVNIKQRLGIRRKVRIRRLYVYAAAATVLLSLIVSNRLFYLPILNAASSTEKVIQDVAPGTNKAILTLANGQRISLDDSTKGNIASQEGITITKAREGEIIYTPTSNSASPGPNDYNSIVTPKGGQYIVQLPDGSKVWLNAASSLKYATSMASLGERRVVLYGEAYFEVFKDKSRPFIVETQRQTVEVLGTHFNINSYTDEPDVKTTLLEGSVKITTISTRLKSKTILKPGQQAILKQNQVLSIQPSDPYAVSWKDGMIRFRNTDLKSIMRQVSRWYNIEVVYNSKVNYGNFTGGINRKSNLSELLEVLADSKIHFTIIEGTPRKLIIEN